MIRGIVTIKLIALMLLASADAHASMPQLDSGSYSSQLFWLFVSFCVMYYMMAKFALPHVRTILERREEVIHTNLDNASQAKGKAEDIKISYDNALRQADNKADEHLKETADKIAKDHADRIKAANEKILKKIQEAEEKLASQVEKMKKDVEKDADKISSSIIASLTGQQKAIAPKKKKKNA